MLYTFNACHRRAAAQRLVRLAPILLVGTFLALTASFAQSSDLSRSATSSGWASAWPIVMAVIGLAALIATRLSRKGRHTPDTTKVPSTPAPKSSVPSAASAKSLLRARR